jgi:hypothetical protein
MIKLKFKAEETKNGNKQFVANYKGTLSRLSEQDFSYVNGAGDTVNYKLATVSFNDLDGVKHTLDSVVVYATSLSKGMELGQTYLGRISRSFNADGTARKPWVALYSAVAGKEISDADFDAIVLEEELAL